MLNPKLLAAVIGTQERHLSPIGMPAVLEVVQLLQETLNAASNDRIADEGTSNYTRGNLERTLKRATVAIMALANVPGKYAKDAPK